MTSTRAELIRKQTTLGFGAPNLATTTTRCAEILETKRSSNRVPEPPRRHHPFHTLNKPDLVKIVNLEMSKSSADPTEGCPPHARHIGPGIPHRKSYEARPTEPPDAPRR